MVLMADKQLMNEALSHHQRGSLLEAEVCYRGVLDADPDNVQALHYFGVLLHQLGRSTEALEFIAHALQLDGRSADIHSNLAKILHELGRHEEAVASCERALAINPGHAPAHNNRGVALRELGRLTEAAASFQQALTQQPDYVEAGVNLGMMLLQEGKLHDAETCLRAVVARRPLHAPGHYQLGMVLKQQGRLQDALESMTNALNIRPEHTEATIALGAVYYELGDLDKATRCCERALELAPNSAEGHNNLGVMFHEQGLLEEAIACYQRALYIQPEYIDALNNLGMSCQFLGKTDLAKQYYQQSLALRPQPGISTRLTMLLPVIMGSEQDIVGTRRQFSDNLAELAHSGVKLTHPLHEVGAANFYLAYHGQDDLPLQRRVAEFYIGACQGLRYQAAHCTRPVSVGRRLRVGFISKFMRQHSIGKTTRGIIAHLDRKRFHVTVLFAPPFVDDAISQFIRAHADEHRLLPLSLDLARQQIEELQLDILFYQDIGMDPFTYFLAFSRLAPVQCTSFGHPVTSGIPSMDYYITTEDWEPEDGDSHYSERLVALRGVASVAYYYQPELPAVVKPRAHFGLAEHEHLYICPQTLFKFHPQFDAVLADILRADPLGRVVLIEGAYRHWGESLRERMWAFMPDVMDRISFLPSQPGSEFLNLLAVCDVMLDTLHFCGFNTTLEGFAAGLPVVTLPGRYMRSRHSLAFYRKMNVMDCVARDMDDYVRIALRLAGDKEYRASISQKIISASAVLWEEKAVVREFESAFLAMTAERDARGTDW